MKSAPNRQQHYDLYSKYYGQDSEISRLLGECGVKSWADLLQSDDVFLRRNARIDLSLQGEAALATIGELVQADNYREQLGGVVALSIMPEAERCKARENPGLIAAIAGLAKSEDPTLRETATRALIVPKDCD